MDAVDPRGEAGCGGVLLPGPEHAQEHLLRQVLRIRRGAQVPGGQAHHSALVAMDQLRERRRIAPLEAEHQLRVVVRRRLFGPVAIL